MRARLQRLGIHLCSNREEQIIRSCRVLLTRVQYTNKIAAKVGSGSEPE